MLGVPPEQIIVEKFETRKFPEMRQQMPECLFKIRHDFEPHMVFVHTKSDIHQDHNVATEEVGCAYRGTTVLGYGE